MIGLLVKFPDAEFLAGGKHGMLDPVVSLANFTLVEFGELGGLTVQTCRQVAALQ
jgi:hypothetical protein